MKLRLFPYSFVYMIYNTLLFLLQLFKLKLWRHIVVSSRNLLLKFRYYPIYFKYPNICSFWSTTLNEPRAADVDFSDRS